MGGADRHTAGPDPRAAGAASSSSAWRQQPALDFDQQLESGVGAADAGRRRGGRKLRRDCAPSELDGLPGKRDDKDKAQRSTRYRYEGQFFKTRLCAFWEKNLCTRGAQCKYAHGAAELHQMPDLTKTSLCRTMVKEGSCSVPNCPFAHSPEDLRATDKFYKTTMCGFSSMGRCWLGDLCRHAHHENELRNISPGARRCADDDDLNEDLEPGVPFSRAVTQPVPRRRVAHASGGQRGLQDWERHETPPARMQPPPPPPAPVRGEQARPSQRRAAGRGLVLDARSSRLHRPLTGARWCSEDDDDDDELGELPNSWSRATTLPAAIPRATAPIPAGNYDYGAPMRPPVLPAQGAYQSEISDDDLELELPRQPDTFARAVTMPVGGVDRRRFEPQMGGAAQMAFEGRCSPLSMTMPVMANNMARVAMQGPVQGPVMMQVVPVMMVPVQQAQDAFLSHGSSMSRQSTGGFGSPVGGGACYGGSSGTPLRQLSAVSTGVGFEVPTPANQDEEPAFMTNERVAQILQGAMPERYEE